MPFKYRINMCEGPLAIRMLQYSLPLMLTSTLQLLYNATDIVVVGRYAGQDALSAVGSTGPLINLLLTLFLGLSIGTSVSMSRYFGANDYQGMQSTLHCSIAVALISGFFVGIAGFILCEPLLSLMSTPPEVIGGSALYMRIFFIGMPFNMIYTFGAAVLRAVGDTKRPLYFLSISGLVNVILNLIFVIVFNMGVAGVAIATIVAQALSAFFVVRTLIKSDGALNLNIKEIKIHKDKLFMLIKIGLPAGIQGSFFSLSNVIIQSSINSFGSIAMAGNAASGNLEGFIYMSLNAFYQSNVTFVSANMGAKKYKRARQCLWYSFGMVSVTSVVVCSIFYFFAEPLVGLYNSDPIVIAYGVERLQLLSSLYILCGFMEVLTGQLRGVGYSLTPMIISLCGVCGIRITWIYFVFGHFRTLQTLYLSYPVTWTITIAASLITYIILSKKTVPKEDYIPLKE